MTNPPSMVAASTSRQPLAVINGCPRSGTSVLNTLLAARLNAALMPETHFIPLFAPYLRLWGGLKTAGQRERLIRAIYDFTEIRTKRIKGKGLDVERMRPYTLLATAGSAPTIARESHSYAEVLEALFDDYRARHNGALAVEKTAYYAPVPWQRIADVLPSAKFLNVVRDGRDVALSWRKTWFGPKSIALSAELWAAHIDAGLEWERTQPERALRVRYEDLVTDTESVLGAIAAFLGVPLLETAVQQSSVEWLGELADHEHMQNLGGPINSSSVSRWQGRMTPEEVATFEAIAGDALEVVGYSRSLPVQAAVRRGGPTAVRTRAQLRRLASGVEWKRRMMRLLPVPLFLAGSLGLSLPATLRRLGLIG